MYMKSLTEITQVKEKLGATVADYLEIMAETN